MGKIATDEKIKATYSRLIRLAEFIIGKGDRAEWTVWDKELLESVRHKDGPCIFIPIKGNRLFICNGVCLEAGKPNTLKLIQLANSITKHNCFNRAYIYHILDRFVEEVSC